MSLIRTALLRSEPVGSANAGGGATPITLSPADTVAARAANTTALRAAFESTTSRTFELLPADSTFLVDGGLFIRDGITIKGNKCTIKQDMTIGGTASTGAVMISNSSGDLLVTFPAAHGISTNSRIAFAAAGSSATVETDAWGGTVPGNLQRNIHYYAIVISPTTIKVSLTNNGAAIAYSSAGSGHITVSLPQKQIVWVDPAYTLGSYVAPGYNDDADRWQYHIDVSVIDNTQSIKQDTGTVVFVTKLTVATADADGIALNDVVRLTGDDPVMDGTLNSTGRSTISSIDSGGGATDSELTTSAVHGITTGQPCWYYTDTFANIPVASPVLTKFQVYYANVVSTTKVKLYDTAANAIAGGATGLVNFSAGIISGTHYLLRAGYLNGEGGMRVLHIEDNGNSTTTLTINRITQSITAGIKLSKWKENTYDFSDLNFAYLRHQSFGMAFSGNPNAPGSLDIQAVLFYAPDKVRLKSVNVYDAPGIAFDYIAPYDVMAEDANGHNLLDQSSTPFPDGDYFEPLAGTVVVDFDGAQPGGSGDNTFTMSIAHGLDAGTTTTGQIIFTSTGSVPAPLVSGTLYYARDITATSFKVATTDGGSAINITNAGTGTITVSASLYPDDAIGYAHSIKAAVKAHIETVSTNTRHDFTSNPSWQFLGGATCRGLRGRNQRIEFHGNGSGQGKSSGADTHSTDIYVVIHYHATGMGGNAVNMRSDGEVHFYGEGCVRVTQLTGTVDTQIKVKMYGAAIDCGEIQNNGYCDLTLIDFEKSGHLNGATSCQHILTDGTGAYTSLVNCKLSIEDIAGNVVQTQNGGRTDADANTVIRPKTGITTLTQSQNAFNYVKGATGNSGVLRGAIVEGAGWNRIVNASGSGADPNISGVAFGSSSVTMSTYNSAFTSRPLLKLGADHPIYAHTPPIAVGGTSRTMTEEDNGRSAVCTSNSAVAITLPIASLAGWSTEIVQAGLGVLTITALTGATLNGTAAGSITSAGQYSRIRIFCRSNADGASAIYEAVTTVNANPKSVYAAGTVYALTATPAAVTFGTTSPAITLDRSGTWEISGQLKLRYTGATFASAQTVTAKLRRTNNTATDVPNALITFDTTVTTTLSQDFIVLPIPSVFYTAAAANDAISMFASVAVVPSVGTLDVVAASIIAKRIGG